MKSKNILLTIFLFSCLLSQKASILPAQKSAISSLAFSQCDLNFPKCDYNFGYGVTQRQAADMARHNGRQWDNFWKLRSDL